jgi:hypothetical protein
MMRAFCCNFQCIAASEYIIKCYNHSLKQNVTIIIL